MNITEKQQIQRSIDKALSDFSGTMITNKTLKELRDKISNLVIVKPDVRVTADHTGSVCVQVILSGFELRGDLIYKETAE